MATFDTNVLQTYYDNRNYRGAIEYLKSFKAVDAQAQRRVNERIAQLERDAALQESLITSSPNEDIEAFNFMQGIYNNGTLPKNVDIIYNKGTKDERKVPQRNAYGQSYLNDINNLQTNRGKTRLNRIAIDLNSEEDLLSITKELGFNNINANNLGIEYQALGENQHRLVMNKDNKNLYKLINAADKISTRKVSDILGNIAMQMGAYGATGAVAGSMIPGLGNIVGGIIGLGAGLIGSVGEEIYYKIHNDNKLHIKAIDDGNNVYDENQFNVDNIRNAVKTVNEAEERYKKLINLREREHEFTSEVVSSQFLGSGHAEAYNDLMSGKISQEAYDKVTKNWEDYYERLIQNSDFNQYDVYAWSLDSKENRLMRKVDSKDIDDLQAEVLLAMKEGRLSQALAFVDGDIGTKLTIIPKNSSEKGSDEWSNKKGEVYKEVFIQGLFDESADAVFNRDTKTKAAKQNADMKRFNYEQTLSNDVIVGYDKEHGSYIKIPDNRGGFIKNAIPESEILRTLNEAAIIDNSVNEILANMDKNGNLYPIRQNGQQVTLTVEQMLKTFAAAGTAEMFPEGSTTDVGKAYYENALYRKMLNIVNMYRKNYKNN